MRRDTDTLNPRNHADVMVLSQEDNDGSLESHPYWYACIIGIFHVYARYSGPNSTATDFVRTEILWVRWFGRDMTAPGGFLKKRLHHIGFVDVTTGGAFGFIDPAQVIRAVHLIPAFHHMRTDELLPGPSIARRYTIDDDDCQTQEETDWRYFYVNM
jgi:hypothetical protein